MRIGPFELDLTFNTGFTLAEVAAGQARLLRQVRVRNVRGSSSDWLKLTAEAGGRKIRQRSVRNLEIGDLERAEQIEKKLMETLLLPADFPTGVCTGELAVDDAAGRNVFSFTFEVYPRDVIPVDFARAHYLASYISESDRLRSFASDALAGSPTAGPAETCGALFSALLQKHPSYQPPVTARYPDCQKISDPEYVLEYGGSCADLSLLMASLLWVRGLSPVLILFPDHMSAGCMLRENGESFETCSDRVRIIRMIQEKDLLLPEMTDVCTGGTDSAAVSAAGMLDRLQNGNRPCILIHIRNVLRSGHAASLPEIRKMMSVCPVCGFPRITQEDFRNGHCPACGSPLAKSTGPDAGSSFNKEPFRPEDSQEDPPGRNLSPETGSACVHYAMSGKTAEARRLTSPVDDEIRVAGVWQGQPVRSVGERAFQNSRACRILLPDVLTGIGRYAFYGCSGLTHIALPEHLESLGIAAFCSSGLKTVRVPGSVRTVPKMCFFGCRDLEEVTLAEGTEQIAEKAFAGCPSLKLVRIPASVRKIARNAFDPSCSLLLLSQRTVVEH